MGAYHPEVVHFAIALVFAGVAFRLISLSRRFLFTNPAATALIVAGTVACFAAAYTGDAAHDPVERIPGVRSAVTEHEEWGERARNAFVVVSLVDLVALGLVWRQSPRAQAVRIAAAVVGLVGLAVIYEAGEHGGRLVYGYGGGVGIRSGQPEDVNRLFVTASYQQALQDRQAGRSEQAIALINDAAARFPANLELQLTAIEWTTDVAHDPAGALRRLDALQIPPENGQARVRAGLARASALFAQGNTTGARAVLQTLQSEFPNNRLIQRRMEQLASP